MGQRQERTICGTLISGTDQSWNISSFARQLDCSTPHPTPPSPPTSTTATAQPLLTQQRLSFHFTVIDWTAGRQFIIKFFKILVHYSKMYSNFIWEVLWEESESFVSNAYEEKTCTFYVSAFSENCLWSENSNCMNCLMDFFSFKMCAQYRRYSRSIKKEVAEIFIVSDLNKAAKHGVLNCHHDNWKKFLKTISTHV